MIIRSTTKTSTASTPPFFNKNWTMAAAGAINQQTFDRTLWASTRTAVETGGETMKADDEMLRTGNAPVVTNTVKLSGTELGTLPPLVLGGIIKNQNSDFVMQ